MDQTTILTNDGSETYHCKEYGETYHSVFGALEESWKKYVEPCKIKELAKENKVITILDFCFGLGYNTAAAIDAVKDVNEQMKIRNGKNYKECRLEVTAIDNDPKIFKLIKDLSPDFKNYDLIKDLAKDTNKTKIIEKDNVLIYFIEEDARVALKFISEEFDAVFFDPFSPKKCPELWTQDVFEDVYKLMKKGGILATYSCARGMRENMRNAGFNVLDGPIIGRKSPSTIGIKE